MTTGPVRQAVRAGNAGTADGLDRAWRGAGVLASLIATIMLATACSGGRDAVTRSEGGAESGSAAEGSTISEGQSVGSAPSRDLPERPPPVQGLGLTVAEQSEFDLAIEAFLAEPSVIRAGPVVEWVGRSGELRYAPWLLDLVQIGMSNVLNRNAVDVLADLAGQEPTGQTFADLGRIGSLIETWEIDGGAGYRDWKTTVFAEFDPEFEPLLDSVEDPAVFNRLRLGGVRRGGIPELNDPARIGPQEAAEWITDDEIVLGVEIDGEAVAYPFRIIGHHELVNDEIAGIPVALAYCTLCRTGLLFDRRIGEAVLDFQTSGLLINSNKVMVDRQTDTLWHHTAGVAIGGELDGTDLELLPLETTTWAEWSADHPATQVVDIPDPIFFDDPERPPIAYPYEAGGPYANYYASSETIFPVRQAPDLFEAKAEVLGIELAGASLAVAVDAVAGGEARFFPVGTAGVVIVPTSRGARVYDASGSALISDGRAGGEVVAIGRAGTDEAVLDDGTSLPRLVTEQGFWFSWWERFPETLVWPVP